MSTLVVVQKGSVAAIAADQQTGADEDTKCLAQYKAHPTKIVRVGESYVGVSGLTAHMRVLQSLARKYADRFDLSSTDSIFETFRGLHSVLVDEYYLTTDDNEDCQAYQSNHLNLLIANSSGIYEVQSYREVIKYTKFWATGSGFAFALGAMEALYDQTDMSARNIAEKGVAASCLFDRASGPPIDCFTVDLK